MGSTEMTIAAGQFSAGTGTAENTTAAVRPVAAAAAAGAEMVVLPESSPYGTSEAAGAIAAIAEDLDGPFIRSIAAAARQHAVAVVVGTYEKADGRPPYNTLVALDSRGSILGCYRKVHLYDAFGYRESAGITPGSAGEPLVFSAGGFNFGAFTCYDLRFPESARVVVANAGEEPGIAVARISRERLGSVRARVPVLENRRYAVVPLPRGSESSQRSGSS